MLQLSDFFIDQNNITFSEYFSSFKKIEAELSKNNLTYQKKIKIALLSSFTINGIKEILYVKCCGFNVHTEFYIGGYNQYAQEILDPKSDLYNFGPDIVLVFVDIRAIAGELYFLPYQTTADDRHFWATEKVNELSDLALKITKESSAKVILHNLETPEYSPLGKIDNKQTIGFIEAVENVNSSLRDKFKNNKQIFLFDYNAFCSKIGKQNVIDYKMYYLGDFRIRQQYLPSLCHEYAGYIRAFTAQTKKCIVLDLDNTIWGGVIGEEGLSKIHLGPTPQGRPFLEFQKYLLALFKRGIILAINSKNNYEDVIDAFQKHQFMVLKEEHFAAIRINWEDKVSNIRSLAEEINIGLDSMVFIDDDKFNREMMRQYVPEVSVIDLPDDPSLYVKTLTGLNLFDSLGITNEDVQKGQFYEDEKKRRILSKKVLDLSQYLKELEVTVKIEKANNLSVPRISQLTLKTNQFNTTTKRYFESEIKQLNESDGFLVLTANVSDKFGDNGLTGVVIIEKMDSTLWNIDSFLLSCRIIGRRVENALLAHVISEAKRAGVTHLLAEFIKTKKNDPAEYFYKNNGFVKKGKNDSRDRALRQQTETWVFDLSKDYSYPDIIKVITN